MKCLRNITYFPWRIPSTPARTLPTSASSNPAMPLHFSIAFFLHILTEVPASGSFFLRPSLTLQTPQPGAHGVIRQYALLLVSTTLIAAIFLLQPPSQSSCQVAAALALYHVGPFTRAVSRARAEKKSIRVRGRLGWPWVHAGFHSLCIAALIQEALKLC